MQGTYAYQEAWKRHLVSLGSSAPRPVICWWAFVPVYTDKTPRLERPAMQAAHRLAVYMDGLGVAMEEVVTAGQEPDAVPRLGTEGAPGYP